MSKRRRLSPPDDLSIEDLTNWYYGNSRLILRLFVESQRPDPTRDRELMRLDRGRGWRHIMQLIRGSNQECYESIRMNQETFRRLCNTLRDHYSLAGTRECALEEAVAMCLEILGHGQDQRIVAAHFQRAQETVKRKFHEVLDSLLRLAGDILKPNENDMNEVNPHLSSNDRYYPFFSGCVGALDGTHVKVNVRSDQKHKFWNARKQYPSMNVLAICNFDMKFVYAYVGTPGKAHDTKVLTFCARHDRFFPTPSREKYFLVDLGYPNRKGYLSPYPRTRYHPHQWKEHGLPTNASEYFNKRHSSIRSVIERSFGVWKKKWKIIGEPKYDLPTTCKIVVATMALHNFIRESNKIDEDFREFETREDFVTEQTQLDLNETEEPIHLQVSANLGNLRDSLYEPTGDAYMLGIRNDIAKRLWMSR